MKGWLLDTNVVSNQSKRLPDPRVEAFLLGLPRARTFISILTLAEVDQGLASLDGGHVARPAVEAFRAGLEAEFSDRVLTLSDVIVREWGLLRGQRRGLRLGDKPFLDSLLAVTALHHSLHLATRNTRDFEGLGVSIFNPWTDDASAFPIEG